ncbi:MAG: radical SAM protein, partial [Candidatus Micrarchaeia archaeon]
MREFKWIFSQELNVEDLNFCDYSLLDLKIDIAEEYIKKCNFCERKCFVNRKEGKLGFCRVGYESRVASAFSHHGEEPEFVPSGTIFFSGCNSKCVFCQNWDISQNSLAGEVWSPKDISNWIEKKFKSKSIINVNLVGGEPTPNLHNILKSLRILNVNIPIIWNSNMYMSEECMEILNGIVDVYLADFKYGSDECAMKFSSLPNYFRIVSRNHKIAKNQCEVLIRHLVMPNHIECCSKKILSWIKENLGDDVRVNIMSQYRPDYRAYEYPEIDRRINVEEYEEVLKH